MEDDLENTDWVQGESLAKRKSLPAKKKKKKKSKKSVKKQIEEDEIDYEISDLNDQI
jgi:hypothetical protein